MRSLTVLLICFVAVNAFHVPNDINGAGSRKLEKQITDALPKADYDTAVYSIVMLKRRSEFDSIERVLDLLIKEKRENFMEFAYKLWEVKEGQDIVTRYFPGELRFILSGKLVKIINVRDNLALKLGAAVDELNDRIAYGDGSDSTSENISWKFIPIWDEGRVYFKIAHVNRNQYLKLGVSADSENDHAVFGDDRAETRRHEWYLKPVEYNGDVVYYIYNRQYNQGLKLGRATDYAGDRQAYSNGGEVDGHPELFGWHISSFY